MALPALKKALTASPTLEARRRLEPLIEKLTSGALTIDEVRVVRAIEVLERSADTRQVLQALAHGAPGALSTTHAQAALHRLRKP